jgi:hypothetical protein
MAYEEGPEGVGGWMWLFLFGFGFINPISLTFGTAGNLYGDEGLAKIYGARWLPLQVGEWAISILALAQIAVTVWRLFNDKRPQTIRLTMIAIPAIALGYTVLDILIVTLIGGADASALLPIMTPDFIRGVVYTAVWVSYFNVSKRVKNTYYRGGEEELAGVFE